MAHYKTLRLILGDQLNPSHSWFKNKDDNTLYLIAELKQETHYVKHHIQRLMVIGNFCLLTGINPDEVEKWYLGVYIDAIEWVEMPNTRGMSQFADDGIIATKPYCASGNYINKMSNYCKNCQYKVKEKVGNDACPLNSLYWHFMRRHRGRLENNPRIGMVYRNWDKQDKSLRQDTLAQAQYYIDNIETL